MPTYAFKELQHGPAWKIIQSGLVRRSQGEAYARDWLNARGYELVDFEHDNENDAIDIMAFKHGNLYQFTIERE